MAVDESGSGVHGRRPSNRGVAYSYVRKGREQLSAWPRKRGKNLHPNTKKQMEFFRMVQWAWKYTDPWIQAVMTEACWRTPLLPRDVFLMNYSGRAASVIDTQGRRFWSMAAVKNISDSLDVIAQLEGDLLMRKAELWSALHKGDPGDVLTIDGGTGLPTWLPGAPPGAYLPLSGGTLTGDLIAPTVFADGFDLYEPSPGHYGMFRSGTDVNLVSQSGFVLQAPFPYFEAGVQSRFFIAGTYTFSVGATGPNVENGGYCVFGTKVLGAQGAAVADATGAGDVVAQLNTLLARCRAHGFIAT